MQKIRAVIAKVLGFLMIFGTFFVSFFAQTALAADATAYFSPAIKNLAPESTFAITVRVTSTATKMNAISAVIDYPSDLLEMTSINKVGIINLWVQEPTFSNAVGKLSFDAVITNPAFQGEGGKVLTMNFRAKKAGDARITFDTVGLYAHDGLGTPLNTTRGDARISIVPGATLEKLESGTSGTVPATSPQPGTTSGVSRVPGLATIVSSSHPEQDKWYASANANFSWSLTSDVTDTSFLIDRSATTQVGTESRGKITSTNFNDIGADGQWYFHLRLKNAAGWGETAHYPFKVDVTAPSRISIAQMFERGLGDRAMFSIEATDSASGVLSYLVALNGSNEELFTPQADSESKEVIYKTTDLRPGQHTIRVRAKDVAGNESEESVSFIVGGWSSWVSSLTSSSILLWVIVFLTLQNLIFSALVWTGKVHVHHWRRQPK